MDKGVKMVGRNDDKHCTCFKVISDIHSLQDKLEEFGFYSPLLQEDHRQVYGLIKELDEVYQLHIRVFSDGLVEGEIEPRAIYLEHLNSKYSYSAHQQLEWLFRVLSINYVVRRPTPYSCLAPSVNKPKNLTNIPQIVGGLATAVIAVAVLDELFGSKNR